MEITDYTEQLRNDIAVISDKVKRGMLPLVARNPTLDETVSRYVLAQCKHFESIEKPPIALRDHNALHDCADLVMYEELTWSHPDKMSIVEYPVMSERNEESYFDKHVIHSDLQYGDRRYTGRRKTHFTDDNGAPQVRNSRIVEPRDPTIEQLEQHIDLYDALDNAGLTDRQRQAIDLIYFENMTQEEAGEGMGVGQDVVSRHLSAALRKLRKYMTKL